MEVGATQDHKFANIEEQLGQRGGGFLKEETVERLTRNRIRVTEFEISIVQKMPQERRLRRDSPAR
jgi:50S ribosomal subunit-associated GTPase HflX